MPNFQLDQPCHPHQSQWGDMYLEDVRPNDGVHGIMHNKLVGSESHGSCIRGRCTRCNGNYSSGTSRAEVSTVIVQVAKEPLGLPALVELCSITFPSTSTTTTTTTTTTKIHSVTCHCAIYFPQIFPTFFHLKCALPRIVPSSSVQPRPTHDQPPTPGIFTRFDVLHLFKITPSLFDLVCHGYAVCMRPSISNRNYPWTTVRRHKAKRISRQELHLHCVINKNTCPGNWWFHDPRSQLQHSHSS